MSVSPKYFNIFLFVLFSAPSMSFAAHINPDLIGEGINKALLNALNDQELIWRLRCLGILKWQETFEYKKPLLESVFESVGEAQRAMFDKIRDGVRSGTISPEQAQKAFGEIFYKIGTGLNSLVSNFVEQMLPHIGKLAAICVIAYGGIIGFRVLKAYLIMYMNQPKLLRQILQPRQITQTLDNLHYTKETKEKIQYVIDMAKNTAKNPSRATFENVMLWGDPGTGKTAVVEIIAKEADMTLFKTSGGDFAKLKGKDLEQIDSMLRNARENRGWIFKRPVLIFIDEMEELFGSRAQANLSEDARNVLTKLLVEFSTPSSQILLIGATNRPEDMDEAMFRRMPQQIEIGLPDRAGRKAIFKLYVEKLFIKDTKFTKEEQAKVKALFTDSLLEKLADMIGDIAPAEIEDIMNRIKNRSLIYNKGIPTKEIVDYAIKEKLTQLLNRSEGFIRSSTKAKLNAQGAVAAAA